MADLSMYLDTATAAVAGSSFLPRAVLNARSVTGDAPVYRRPGEAGDAVPRADIEVDIDMENTIDDTYLWGALVDDRAGTGLVDNGYLPFVTWKPMGPETEFEVFASFWAWLTDLLARAETAGAEVKAYSWHESAENTQMRRITADTELAEPITAFIDSDTWVDLQKIFKDSWITGDSTGLKMIAPLAGYQWPVDDPGGGLSIVRHAEATAQTPSKDARSWLLDYNRGDVEATATIRDWLSREGSTWPAVEVD